MQQYLNLCQRILDEGVVSENRTGVNTLSVFGAQMRFDLTKGFPLLTTKKVHTKSIIHELLWFLKGETNVKYLKDNGVKIWDEWANENGDLGPVYGKQWRDFGGVDQITWLMNRLKTNPECRRLIVSAWNPADLPKMALAPCHCLFQFHTRLLTREERQREWIWKTFANDGEDKEENPMSLTTEELDKYKAPTRGLSCQLYQRSCDTFLGVPFNIASYALLTMMIAQCVNMAPSEFIWTGGDTHLYTNHLEQVKLQLSREPRPLPWMMIDPEVKDIFSFKYEDFQLVGYDPHPAIKGEVAV